MTQEETDIRFMRMALDEARAALRDDEIPIGAIIVANGQVIGRGHNMTETLADVTAHAEMLAITAATQTLGGKYLTGATIYVTVEPCLMCAGAIAWSQLSRIVYGAKDPKRGYSTYITALNTSAGPDKPSPAETSELRHHTPKIQNPIADPQTSKSKIQNSSPSPFHPKATITTGILSDECATLMRDFFRTKR